MRKKEMIAMLLAGGQGNRLDVLTATKAKPAVFFGGKYRVIDFPMSNCINSGIDTVGVMIQYQPLQLNQHIGIGVPWDLDRKSGGVTILSPYLKAETGEWYTGTADAIFKNIEYINKHNPEYVLILSTDHVYKMDYSQLLDFHKKNNCDVTIAALEVSWEEASRFGIMNIKDDFRIYEFEEKPANPKSNLANMGIYLFKWDILKTALEHADSVYNDADFGKHVLPTLLGEGKKMYAYKFNGYWKDVGTIESYWMANMDLIKIVPELDLYESFSKIYTDSDHQPPKYTGPNSDVNGSLVSDGCEILGSVYNSVLGSEVIVEEGAIIVDSIIMSNCYIGAGTKLYKCIADVGCVIGKNITAGVGDNIKNTEKPHIYDTGITVFGEYSTIPDNVTIGKNCVVYGETILSDYENGILESGKTIRKGAEQ